MTDITMVLETLIRLLCVLMVVVFIPVIRRTGKNDTLVTAIKLSDELSKIAYTVVSAANELEITGDMLRRGETKAHYAMEQMKQEINKLGITCDEEELIRYIKSAVTQLRVDIANTPAEKEVKQG